MMGYNEIASEVLKGNIPADTTEIAELAVEEEFRKKQALKESQENYYFENNCSDREYTENDSSDEKVDAGYSSYYDIDEYSAEF